MSQKNDIRLLFDKMPFSAWYRFESNSSANEPSSFCVWGFSRVSNNQIIPTGRENALPIKYRALLSGCSCSINAFHRITNWGFVHKRPAVTRGGNSTGRKSFLPWNNVLMLPFFVHSWIVNYWYQRATGIKLNSSLLFWKGEQKFSRWEKISWNFTCNKRWLAKIRVFFTFPVKDWDCKLLRNYWKKQYCKNDELSYAF